MSLARNLYNIAQPCPEPQMKKILKTKILEKVLANLCCGIILPDPKLVGLSSIAMDIPTSAGTFNMTILVMMIPYHNCITKPLNVVVKHALGSEIN